MMRQRRAGGGGDLPAYGSGGGGAADGGGGYGGGQQGGGYGGQQGGGYGGQQGGQQQQGGGYGGYNGGYNTGGGGGGAGYGGADATGGAGYGGYGSSPAPAASPPLRKKSSGGGGGKALIFAAIGSFLVLGLSLMTLRYRSKMNALSLERDRADARIAELQRSRSALEGRLNQSETRARQMNEKARDAQRESESCKREAQRAKDKGPLHGEEELGDMREEIHRLNDLLEMAKAGHMAAANSGEDVEHHDDDNEVVNEEMEHLRERAEELEKRAVVLKDHIARESYRSALERFGPGPHTVSIRVELPADAHFPANPSFTIQLHPLAKMPHSVHLFLEQVRHGLWDGCSFIINAEHILQAGAHPGDAVGTDTSPEDALERFEIMKLDVLSYQEYHEDYPHDKYTVGFAGRPGGPDFYINMMDNTENHGPHGQRHEVLSEEADPCFGTIVDGRDVVDRLAKLEISDLYRNENDDEEHQVLAKPLHILEAKVLGVDVPPPPRWILGPDWSATERGAAEETEAGAAGGDESGGGGGNDAAAAAA